MKNLESSSTSKTASLHRMVMDDHVCPYGLKAKDLLERRGFDVDDHHLTTKEETDAFKQEHDVKTTPQIFIDGERIGGHDALRQHFGEDVLKPGDTTYRPVLVIFAMALLLAVSVSFVALESVMTVRLLEWFAAFAMCLLALQKLRDVESFSTMFLNYDLLARRWVRYGYVYPYAEALAGLLMIAGVMPWLSGPVALFIGTIGAVSVIKAVYVEQRELKCACVGGESNVPLGAISLTENLVMVVMGIWVLAKTM